LDSQSVIHLGKNPTFHSSSKHIDVMYHWICDALDVKLLELDKVHTGDNVVDMMTKTLSRKKFEACFEIVGLVGSPPHSCKWGDVLGWISGEMCWVGLLIMCLKCPT